MTALNKQALREAAERAASDSWGYDRDEFNDAITPDVALALLDELEAAENRIADLESLTAGMEQEPVYLRPFGDDGETFVACDSDDECAIKLYAAPQLPQPAVVDADDNFYSWFGREWHEHYQHNQYTTAAKQMLGVMAESAWKAGRSVAMLKAGNHTEQHLDMVDHSGDANEKV
nr:ead/Ea22-like family protein [Citrobacter freundii]